MRIQSDRIADQIVELLENSKEAPYFGEPVTQLDHALQCAQLAHDSGAEDETVLAALLHDIGHLLEGPDALRHEAVGTINHDDLGADWLLEHGFSGRVAGLVRSHVAAKRYLTATNPAYRDHLSAASQTTLALQGGPMSSPEASEFAQSPLFRESLRLRSWDEQAKEPGRQVAALEFYRPLLAAHLAASTQKL